MESTLDRLRAKANERVGIRVRMPSIKQISKLLTELNIKHTIRKSVNIVEYRSKGKMYVNSRHRGKEGYRLEITGTSISMDTSDSYYMYNASQYARKIVELINAK